MDDLTEFVRLLGAIALTDAAEVSKKSISVP